MKSSILRKVIPLWILKINIRWEVIHLAKLIIYSQLIKFRHLSNQCLRNYTPRIHIIGDSHSFSFTGTSFYTNYIGAATAYNLLKENSRNQSHKKIYKILTKIKNPQDKLIILVFGEIDCRIHIYNKYSQNNKKADMKKLVLQTVENYGKFISEIKKRYPNLAVFNVVPPGEQDNLYKIPYYANRKIRYYITCEFNNQLKKYCHQNKIHFISIFDQLVDKNTRRISKYKLDRVHFNTKLAHLLSKYLKDERLLSKFVS